MKDVYASVYGWNLTKREIKERKPHFPKFKVIAVYRGKRASFKTTVIVWREL